MPAPARRLESGMIWADAAPADDSGRVVICARVSSRDRRRDLDRPVARLTGRAAGNGEVVREAGCGLDGKRPRLRRVLSGPSAGVVVVEHRDRLAARFGAGHLKAALPAHGRKIVAADPGETAGDLVRDMTGVLAWMCARRYGRRGARDRAVRAVGAAGHGDEARAGG